MTLLGGEELALRRKAKKGSSCFAVMHVTAAGRHFGGHAALLGQRRPVDACFLLVNVKHKK
jgi:hypothetical protein